MRYRVLACPGVLVVACLSGCATPPSGSEAAAQVAAPKPAANPACVVTSHNGLVRPGDNVPIRMVVQQNHGWCFDGLTFGGSSAQGSRITEQPDHGDLRLLVRAQGAFFGYRPRPGYTGHDSFMITMPSVIGGYDFNLAVTVVVHPAT